MIDVIYGCTAVLVDVLEVKSLLQPMLELRWVNGVRFPSKYIIKEGLLMRIHSLILPCLRLQFSYFSTGNSLPYALILCLIIMCSINVSSCDDPLEEFTIYSFISRMVCYIC